MTSIQWEDPDRPGVTHEIDFTGNLLPKKSNSAVRVNFLQYSEYGPDGEHVKYFSWVTDGKIAEDNTAHLARGG